MKGNLFIMAMLGLSIFQLDAQKQINCLIHPTTINAGLDGWNLEWDEGTFILQTEDDVIKVVNSNSSAAMKGKFQQRFTASVNGRYTLTFKAKKDASAGQKIEINLLALDSWANISSVKAVATIDSNEWKDYGVTFQYSDDARVVMPHGAQVEMYVAGVVGNLWFKDFVLTEDNNNLTAYEDDFETDISTGTNGGETNNWVGERLQLLKQGGNTVLEYTQGDTFGNAPWDISFTRYLWCMAGVKYRIWFDMSASTSISAENGVGLEMLSTGGADKIANQYFNLTQEMQTFDLITKATSLCINYNPTFYVGRVPVGEKVYIDNFSIAPIYLYNVTQELVEGAAKVKLTWLHSGYLTEDKLAVYLVGENYEEKVAEGIEIVDGSATVALPVGLPTGQYRLKLADVVGEGDFAVGNETLTEPFQYMAPTTGINDVDEVQATVFVDDGMLCVTNCPEGSEVSVFSLDGKEVRKLTVDKMVETISLESGVYVVRADGRTFKVAL